MRIQHLISAVLCATTIVACHSDNAPPLTEPVPDDPAFAASVSGDQVAALHGITFTQRFVNGYTEVDGSGHAQSTNVVLVGLSSIEAVNPPQVTLGPQLNLGLLGSALAPGTYRVHTSGSAVGTSPEFYGGYAVMSADSTQTLYQATSGTVTITAVSPRIQGTFTFHSAQSFVSPAHRAVTGPVPSSPASLDVTGSFIARVP